MAVGGPNIPGGATLLSFTGTNATGFTFTLSQNALATSATNVITVGAMSNAYTGTTTINSSTDQYAGGTTNLTGLPGSIVIPGNLTINGGATVTMNTNQGQIASTSAMTINGSGVLNLVGTNRFSTTLTFNNSGGNATPTVAVGTLLDLSSTAAITANNDNNGFTPTISGTGLNFSSATGTTINVTGQSINDLIISAAITTNQVGTTTSTGQTITKTGAGSLILNSADANSLTWALNGGSIFVGNATSLGTNASAGALSLSGNVGLASSANNLTTTIALPTIFTGTTNLTLGAQLATSSVILSGAMNLNNQSVTFTVPAVVSAESITGQIIGAGGFTKAGPGALTVSNGANTLTGPINVSGGLLTLGAAGAFGTSNTGADYTVGTTAEINLNAFALSIGSLSGGGIVTNSGASQTLTIGAGGNATNATFSGVLVAATPASLLVTKIGTNTQTLTGQSYYTGATTVNGGTLTLGLGGNLVATPVTVNNGGTFGAQPGISGASNAIGSSLALTGGATFIMADSATSTLNVSGTAAFSGVIPNTFVFDFNSSNSTTSDLLAIVGATTASGAGEQISVNNVGTVFTPGSQYTLISALSGLGTSKFSLATTKITIGGTVYSLSLANSTATTEILTLTSAAGTGPNAAYWTGSRGNVWNNTVSGATNWATDITGTIDTQAQPSAITDVFFTANGAANLTNSLGANYTINSLNFNTASVGGVTVNPGNILTINGATGITVASGSAAETFNAAIALGNIQTWTNNSANLLTIGGPVITNGFFVTAAGAGNFSFAGPVSGSGGFGVSGAGTVTLAGTNTYSGVTGVTGGALSLTGVIGDGGGTGGTAITTSATFSETSTGSITNASSLAVNGGTTTLAGYNNYTGATSITGGTVSLTGSLFGSSVTVNGGTLNESAAGIIGGAGNTFTLTSGSATLLGANAYTGATTISAGTLNAGNLISLGNGSAVSITAGATLNLNGSSLTIGSLATATGTITDNGAGAREQIP